MLNSLAVAKLLLEIQLPSLEDCWNEGNILSSTNSLEDNPYKPGTANFHHWQDGWWFGKFKDDDTNDYLKKAANDEIVEQQKIIGIN